MKVKIKLKIGLPNHSRTWGEKGVDDGFCFILCITWGHILCGVEAIEARTELVTHGGNWNLPIEPISTDLFILITLFLHYDP